MHQPAGLRFSAFGSADPLGPFDGLRQVRYLRRYLDRLGAKVVLEEPNYFDKDYLSEFSAFYCTSSTGYSNACKRLHFFADAIDRASLEQAAGGDAEAVAKVKAAYLGFSVVRPIPAAPLGRTVLSWFPDGTPQTPRVTTPSRKYTCHVAGLSLEVEGLAWQQQDSAVGACATIALWTSLHSSAFEGYHALPTTAGITQAAHKSLSFGARVFPSGGLTVFQLCEVIKQYGLSPLVVEGDQEVGSGERRFSRDKFTSSCSALIRSGYPAIISCAIDGAPHAVCAVGFRSAVPATPPGGHVGHHDSEIPHVYIDDDNLGPNVRCEIVLDPGNPAFINLKPSAPGPTAVPDATAGYPAIVPSGLIAAVPEEIRTSPDTLYRAGLEVAGRLSAMVEAVMQANSKPAPGLVLSTRFIKLRDYLGGELGRLLEKTPPVLSRVRLALAEKVRPMSLHLGVARIGVRSAPIIDVLYDTTDSDRNHLAFAHIVFIPGLDQLMTAISWDDVGGIGVCVPAS